jgi:hypothetical protein
VTSAPNIRSFFAVAAGCSFGYGSYIARPAAAAVSASSSSSDEIVQVSSTPPQACPAAASNNVRSLVKAAEIEAAAVVAAASGVVGGDASAAAAAVPKALLDALQKAEEREQRENAAASTPAGLRRLLSGRPLNTWRENRRSSRRQLTQRLPAMPEKPEGVPDSSPQPDKPSMLVDPIPFEDGQLPLEGQPPNFTLGNPIPLMVPLNFSAPEGDPVDGKPIIINETQSFEGGPPMPLPIEGRPMPLPIEGKPMPIDGPVPLPLEGRPIPIEGPVPLVNGSDPAEGGPSRPLPIDGMPLPIEGSPLPIEDTPLTPIPRDGDTKPIDGDPVPINAPLQPDGTGNGPPPPLMFLTGVFGAPPPLLITPPPDTFTGMCSCWLCPPGTFSNGTQQIGVASCLPEEPVKSSVRLRVVVSKPCSRRGNGAMRSAVRDFLKEEGAAARSVISKCRKGDDMIPAKEVRIQKRYCLWC